MRWLTIGILCGLGAACGGGGSADAETQPRWVVLGSSTAAGVGASTGNGWAAKLGVNAGSRGATLSNLESVIRNLRNLTGRKILILLSDGFYLGGASSSQIYDMRRITDAATRAGVVIYSIDARGLIAVPPGGSASDPASVGDLMLPGARVEIEAVAAAAG